MALFKKEKSAEAPVQSDPKGVSHKTFVDEQERIRKELDNSPFRKKGETQAEYNLRIPVALQPVQPGPTESYLGKKL